MSQNLIQLNLTPDAVAAISTALTTLETELSGLLALTPDQRREISRMGDKSEAFCRQAVVVFSEHPGVLPRNFDLEGYRSDLASLDILRPLLARLNRLHERVNDTEAAIGSDLMANSLEGYAVLKVAGKGEGLDNMRRMLSARFSRNRARQPASEPTVA